MPWGRTGEEKVVVVVVAWNATDDNSILYVTILDQIWIGDDVDSHDCPSHCGALMHLYLGNHPRVLYLVTGSHDDRLGRPQRALVFCAGENASQAVVEFLPKDQVSLINAVLLTSRVVKGCLGLISVDNGTLSTPLDCLFSHPSDVMHQIYSWLL